MVSEAERPAQRARQERVRYLAEADRGGLFRKAAAGRSGQRTGRGPLLSLPLFPGSTSASSFQEYLAKLRCEKGPGRELLLTDRSLLDISLSCGFSSPKYFQRAFQKQYGATPREYRRQAPRETGELPAASVLTSQKFLSDQESLRVVQRLLEQG